MANTLDELLARDAALYGYSVTRTVDGRPERIAPEQIVIADYGPVYTTIADTHRNNGNRHAENARRHLAEGRPEYAAGSMRKAQRNWERAAEAEQWQRHIPEPLRNAFGLTLAAIEANLYGSGNSQ